MSTDSLYHALAGSASGIVAMAATYPLIVSSTRAAVETSKTGKSTIQAIADILKREGLGGLYSGLTSSMLGVAVTNGTYYYFYERGRTIIVRARASKGLTTLESMLIGLLAGSVTTIITNPIWVVQVTQSVRKKDADVKKHGFFEACANIFEEGGLRAFWRGLGPALVLVANPVLQYTVFEQLRNLLVARRTPRQKDTGSVLTDFDYFLLGALSKLVATAVTYPYIVIKSRMQAGSESAARYKSALDGMLTVLSEEGVSGLYKGAFSKLVQSVLTAAVLFASQRRIYEIIKKTMKSMEQTKLQAKR